MSTAEMLSVTGFAPSLRATSNQTSKADELCPAWMLGGEATRIFCCPRAGRRVQHLLRSW